MRDRVAFLLGLTVVLAAAPAFAAGVRDFTRPSNPAGTAVNETQATELTLTLTEAAMRPIQTWVRTAGTVDRTGRILTAVLRSPEAELVKEGQRLTAYTVNTRTRMNLGRVTRVTRQNGGALVEATLPVQVPSDGTRYLMEIVTERGPYLSIPNVSIIEEGSERIVYVQKEPNRYAPQVVKTGLQGELYTQVLDGLAEGDEVVSFGSFFINAETKLKSGGMPAMPGMDHSQMPGMAGMDHGTHVAAAPAGKAAPPAVDHSAHGAHAPAASRASPTGGTSLVMTDPSANARVSAPVAMIHVMFSQPVDVKASGFEVTANDGKAIDVGPATIMGSDGKMLMAMPKTPLPAGTYRVKWHAVGPNSQRLQGEFTFTAQ
jgi:methionine-rich copper-binding protein CopC